MPDPQTTAPPADFTFARRGRSPAAFALVTAWLAALLGLWLLLEASPVVIALLTLPVVPALLDLIRNPSAGLTMSPQRVDWHSGRLTGFVKLEAVDHLRLDTRWDFSRRATLVLKDGQRLRLPQEATPPIDRLEAAFAARGLRCKRHHFSPF